MPLPRTLMALPIAIYLGGSSVFAAPVPPEAGAVRCTVSKTTEKYREGASPEIETRELAKGLRPRMITSEGRAIHYYLGSFDSGEVAFTYQWAAQGLLDLSFRSNQGAAVRTYSDIPPVSLADAAENYSRNKEVIRQYCRATHTPEHLCGPVVGSIRLQLRGASRPSGEDVHVEATCVYNPDL